jgi:hypothetical protein
MVANKRVKVLIGLASTYDVASGACLGLTRVIYRPVTSSLRGYAHFRNYSSENLMLLPCI